MPPPHVSQHPLVRALVTRLRDRTTMPAEFRMLIDNATGLLLHEALADVALEATTVETPLAPAHGWSLSGPIVFVPILRAGLGMVDAATRLVPDGQVRHLGLYRDERTLEPVVYYNRLEPGDLAGTTVVLLDPMLATAGSAVAATGLVKAAGATDLRLVGLVGAPEGVRALAAAHPDVRVFLAALDERLTAGGDAWPAGYILPGLGDAGDRQFGT